MYVGAVPDLVRGFITTPLERVDALLMASNTWNRKAQGLSTITARLKLNQDPTKALRPNQFRAAGSGAWRLTARSRSAGAEYRICGQSVRLGLSQLCLPMCQEQNKLPTIWCDSTVSLSALEGATGLTFWQIAPAMRIWPAGSNGAEHQSGPGCAPRWPLIPTWPRQAIPRGALVR